MKYVKGFDTLRAVAVLFVIISHWGLFFTPGSSISITLAKILPTGQFGVTLFFVLSGFLITSILLNERFKNALEGGSTTTIIKGFFVRRALRIFPIYYLTILVLVLLKNTFLLQHIWYYLFYLGNIPPYKENAPNPVIHLWSLAVEEQFYLVWPWIVLFIKEKYLKYVFFGAILIGIVSKYLVIFVYHHTFTYLVINCFDSFGLGGLYAYMRLREMKGREFEKIFKLVLALMLFVGVQLAPVSGHPLGVIYFRTLESVVSLGMIMFVLDNKYVWINKYILENRFLNYLGKISYGLYLYHYIAGPYFDELIKNEFSGNAAVPAFFHTLFFGWALKFIMLFVLCWISYNFIELPFLRLKRKFSYH